MKRAAATLTVAALCLVASTASAATITLGSYDLLENTTDQKIPIYVVGEPGDPAVAAVQFYVQIADGGTGFAGGSIDGPIISYVQLVDDWTTVDIYSVPPGDFSESQRGNGYDAYHTAAFGPTFFESPGNFGHISRGWPLSVWPAPSPSTIPQLYIESTAFTSGGRSIPVGVESLLGVVTIDTTGFFADDERNPWQLNMDSTLVGSTALIDTAQFPKRIPLTIENGQINVVPEPSTAALVLAGLLGAAVLIWKR